MTPTEIAEARQLIAAAQMRGPYVAITGPLMGDPHVCVANGRSIRMDSNEDALMVASALNNWPAALDEVAELEKVKTERDAARTALAEYKAAVTAQLHYDMASVITGTPEQRSQAELTEAVRIARQYLADLGANRQPPQLDVIARALVTLADEHEKVLWR